MQEICDDFVFNFANDISIETTKSVLKKFYENFESAFNLNSNFPIFLDTNILLNYYGMSLDDKSKLIRFFESKLDNLYITQQIEKEFQRNRESTISDYFNTLSEIKKNYEEDLQKGIKNKFNNILQSKIVEKDFPEVMTAIREIYEELDKKLFQNEELAYKITSSVNEVLSQNKSMLFIDPILDTYSKFHRTPDLKDAELDLIKKKYNEYLEVYKSSKESVKNRNTFPGCGESKDFDTHGDFIIFHEILKFMKNENSDAILLTRDVTKSDWLKRDREPHIHYILKAFQLTGQTLYIFDATDLLKIISFDNIYKTDILAVEDDYDEDLGSENFYRSRFQGYVNSIKMFLEEDLEDVEKYEMTDRSSVGHDLDLVGFKQNDEKVGVLVYHCGSTKKGFQSNIQKRINSCNKFISDGTCQDAILAVVLRKKEYLRRLDYNYLNTNHNMRIIIFSTNDLNDFSLELLTDRII